MRISKLGTTAVLAIVLGMVMYGFSDSDDELSEANPASSSSSDSIYVRPDSIEPSRYMWGY